MRRDLGEYLKTETQKLLEASLRTASRMVYQAAYAAALLMPGSNAAAFAAKAEANAQKHAPAGIAVAVNLFVLGYLGSVKIREERVKDDQRIEATIDAFPKPVDKPAGGGGGGSPTANIQIAVTPPATPTVLPSAITTTAPAAFTFNVPKTSPSISGLPSGVANGQGGTGTGTGTGNGSGTGPGTGSGTGGGNGAGSGKGSGNGVVDNRIPIILVYTEYNSIAWSDSQLKEAEATSAARFDKVLGDLRTIFKVVASDTVRNNNAAGHKDKGMLEDLPDSENLNDKTPTSARIVYELAQAHPEAVAIIYCGGWEDADNMPEAQELGKELGRRLAGMGKKFYMMTFSKFKGFASSNPFEATAKITGGGFKNSAKDIAYELGKTYVPPQQ